jgi:hypothetical protein
MIDQQDLKIRVFKIRFWQLNVYQQRLNGEEVKEQVAAGPSQYD